MIDFTKRYLNHPELKRNRNPYIYIYIYMIHLLVTFVPRYD